MNKKLFPLMLFALFLTAIFIKNPVLTAEMVRNGLNACAGAMLPALFPFMVLSGILCDCGVIGHISRFFPRRVSSVFGVSKKSMAAITAGLFLGFPIGAVALSRLFDNGEIDGSELERAIGFCGVPSFGFTVGAVGISLFGDKRFGLFMYFTAIIAALLSGVIFSRGGRDFPLSGAYIEANKKSPSAVITDSVSRAAGATLTLCAYVVFFYCVSGCISEICGKNALGAFIGIFLEMSSGVALCAKQGGALTPIFCGLALGWEGLSVHFQTASLLSSRVKSYKNYFFKKGFQALLCGGAAMLYGSLREVAPIADASSLSVALPVSFFVFLIFCAIASLKMKIKKPNDKR